MGQLTAFEFVLLLIVAETTQQALLGEDFSITNSLLLIVTLFAMDVGLSYVKGWSPRLAIWLDGQPTVLISRARSTAAPWRAAASAWTRCWRRRGASTG